MRGLFCPDPLEMGRVRMMNPPGFYTRPEPSEMVGIIDAFQALVFSQV